MYVPLVLSIGLASPSAERLQETPAQETKANPDAQLLADFQARVKAYLELRSKLEATLPPLSTQGTAEEIQQRQVALERLIRQARSGARQGDLLTQPLRAFIRRQMARVLGGPDGPKIMAALKDEQARGVKLHINGRYPDDQPLATVPPQILLSLPRLPRELEFRFVEERLALLDGPARTVLDFMDNALP